MYAGFWKRFAALIIDNILLNVLVYVVILAAGYDFSGQANPDISRLLIIFFAVAAICLLYWPLFESSPMQATPGKMALGIKVTDLYGGRVGFFKALGRNLGKIISGMTLNIGYAMAGFTVRKQALHDKMASCLVIDKNADTQNLQPLPPASGTLIFFAILGAISPFIIYIAAMVLIFMAFFKMSGIPSSPTDLIQTSEIGGYISEQDAEQEDILPEEEAFTENDYDNEEIRKVRMMGDLLKIIAKIQEMYAERNNGQYAKSFEELKANVPSFPDQSYEVGTYKLALKENYITASTEDKDGVPAHTITQCYAKDRMCIYAHVFTFVEEVDIPYSQPGICCL